MRRLIAMAAARRPHDPARERGPLAIWRRRLLRSLPAGLPVVVAVALASWLVLGGIAERRLADLRSAVAGVAGDAGMTVARVLVDGRERTDRQSLIDAVGVSVGESLLAVDIDTARARVAALPWVREASVERRLPDTVVVRIVERRPLALWQNEGAVHVVDADGRVIDGARGREFPELLLVVGPDAPGRAAELLAVVQRAPDLAERIVAAVRVSGRRWNLKLDDGIEIQLPEDDLAGAWSTLVQLEASDQLLARDVQAVDLRLPDRLVLRLTPDAQARMTGKEAEGEDT